MKTIIAILALMMAGCYESDAPEQCILMDIESDEVFTADLSVEASGVESTDRIEADHEATQDVLEDGEAAVDPEPMPLCVPEDECIEWCVVHGFEGGMCWRYLEDGSCACFTIRSSCECF